MSPNSIGCPSTHSHSPLRAAPPLATASHTGQMERIWVPIAIALFGNAVAVVIVILTNRAAIAREQSRQAHEANRWLREDRWRVSEVQRDYYVSFYRQIRSASLAVPNAGHKIGPPLEGGWQLPAYEALVTSASSRTRTLTQPPNSPTAPFRSGETEPSPVLCRFYAGAITGWHGVSRSA